MTPGLLAGAQQLAEEREAEVEQYVQLQKDVERLFLAHAEGVTEMELIDEAVRELGADSSLVAEAVVSLRSRNIARKDWATGRLTRP